MAKSTKPNVKKTASKTTKKSSGKAQLASPKAGTQSLRDILKRLESESRKRSPVLPVYGLEPTGCAFPGACSGGGGPTPGPIGSIYTC